MLQYQSVPTLPTTTPTSILGVQLGLDTSGNFAWSVNGLAVLTPSGRFVRKDDCGDFLVDVTPLNLPVNPQVYLLPAPCVAPGDLLITASDPNFAAMYVMNADTPDNILALDTATSLIVRYSTPANLFFNFYVKAISLFDVVLGE
jgi:hypothetical protein